MTDHDLIDQFLNERTESAFNVEMYGDLHGIIGKSLTSIETLELASIATDGRPVAQLERWYHDPSQTGPVCPQFGERKAYRGT